MEVSETISLKIDSIKVRPSQTRTRTATGGSYDIRSITVTTGEVTHTIDSSVGNCRELFIRNEDDPDTGNYITFGTVSNGTTTHQFQVRAGRDCKVDLPAAATAIYLIADTASVPVTIVVVEE